MSVTSWLFVYYIVRAVYAVYRKTILVGKLSGGGGGGGGGLLMDVVEGCRGGGGQGC